MSLRFFRASCGLMLGLFAVGAATSPAGAAIRLEWDPNLQAAMVGNVVNVGLYAVSDGNPTPNQSMSSIDMILAWDPSYLQLIGVTNNGPYGWMQSNFPNDSGLNGINNTWADGNAFYRALAQFAVPPNPAWATPTPGLLVTTFRFLALAETPSTMITIPPEYFGPNFPTIPATTTRIQDGFTAGLFVQTPPPWGSAKVQIIPEPATLALVAGALAAGLRRRRAS
jgi:hypothetical protein